MIIKTLWNSQKELMELQKKEVDVLKSLELKKLFKEIAEELGIVDKVRIDLVTKYGAMNDKTKQIEVKLGDKNWEKYVDDFDKLLNKEVELKHLKKATLSVTELQGNKVSPSLLTVLDWLIK